jgi:hypothetical protein
VRRNIYDILKSAEIDLLREYSRLYEQFYNTPLDSYYCRYNSIALAVENNFILLDKQLIGRCISLEDFDDYYGFYFEEQPRDFDVYLLINFAEYILMFCIALRSIVEFSMMQPIMLLIQNIFSCMEDIGYTSIEKDSFTLFVEKNPAAISVAEITEPKSSYSVLEYNHHRLRGNLSKKKVILKHMADDIELRRNELNRINKAFTSDFFQLLNKFIRHDTSENDQISKMTEYELETVYDDIYQMWLLAKLQLDHIERKERVSSLLKDINE